MLVNGVVVIDHGRHTGARPGQVLYGPGRIGTPPQTAAPRTILSAPIEVSVPKPPVPFLAQGQTHLVYELHITNLGADDCLLDRVAVFGDDGTDTALAQFEGEPLADKVARPGVPALRGAAKLRIGSGQRAVLYVWVSLPAEARPPRMLRHHLTVKLGEPPAIVSTEAARTAVSGRPAELGPPLRGGGWLAGNGPSNTSGHRRAGIAIEGTQRTAQRFAIDWVQLGPNNSTFDGDPKDNTRYFAYGEDVLAVADGVVSAIKDGIPENVPGLTSRAVPITLDTIGGNHVILQVGPGIYAFYAHVQPGSIKVRVGDKVRRGQVLALVGNSGNSTEPHLHFHVADASSPLGAEGLPYVLASFDVEGTATLTGGKVPLERLATPERRKMELPLQNVVVRFPDR